MSVKFQKTLSPRPSHVLRSSDESRARVCIRHVAQYLRWTLHFALFYEAVMDYKRHCYTDASWSLEGDHSHQAIAIYQILSKEQIAWQSQRRSLVALSSTEAELIACVWKSSCIESLRTIECDDTLQACLYDLL